MKQNEEEVQYYYDSLADQWWCFDEQQQCWVPWKEEESDDAGGSESNAAAAGVTDEADANGAAPAGAATRRRATVAPAVTEYAGEKAVDTSEKLELSGQLGDTKESGEKAHSASSAGDATDTVGVRSGGAQQSATAGSVGAGGVAATAEDSERAADNGRSLRERKTAAEAGAAARLTAANRSEAEGETDVDSSSTGQATGVTERRTKSGTAAAAADGRNQEQLRRKSAEKNETEENEQEKNETASVQEVDRLRSALESLATSPCLDHALMQISSSGSFDRMSSASTVGGGILAERTEDRRDKATPGSIASQLSRDGSRKVMGLRGTRLPEKIDEEHTADEEDEEGQDVVEELPDIVKHDPIVRRSTRMLTFKDKGGLAGCLREAAKQRNDMIKEAGGYIPGTEQYREEAWKQRARELASQTHVRTQNKWKEAARKVFDTSAGKDSQDKVMHFADLVDRIRRKSEGDREQAMRAQAELSRFATYSLGSMSAMPPKSRTSLDPEVVAANFLLKPDVDLREQRRRSSGFPGGQQGHVRFADAAFRDPNSQLQMQDLLTHQSRRKAASREEDAASSVAPLTKQESSEQGSKE